ncbi:MAG TPA: DMT family transporter [Anaerolineales bacterium]|nr:DMT family transporter [Anaerolineales bacterium]
MPVFPLLEAILVVGVWSTSFPLVKISLTELSPFQVAGVRYFGAFLALVPFLLTWSRGTLKRLPLESWVRLAAMGVISYPVGNGLLFWGLQSLQSTTSAFLLNAMPLATLGLGVVWLKERPTRRQLLGLVFALGGGVVFFGTNIPNAEVVPILATVFGAVCLAVFGVMAREFARNALVDGVTLAGVPLLFGGGLLMILVPPAHVPSARVFSVLVWLALVNSALAYLIWNHALRRLQAFEISIVANLMPIGTALIAPVLVGETVEAAAWVGMAVALAGVILVGLGGRRQVPSPAVGGA